MSTSCVLRIFEEWGYQVVDLVAGVNDWQVRRNTTRLTRVYTERRTCRQSNCNALLVPDPILVSVLRSMGSTGAEAYKVTPHPCSVGTAEIDSVNHSKGVNHGKDWDYAPINVAPGTLIKQASTWEQFEVDLTLSFVRTLVCCHQIFESLFESHSSFCKGPSRKRGILVGRSFFSADYVQKPGARW